MQTTETNILFPLSPAEQHAIRRACAKAAQFMQKFGKGYTPAQIDKSRYVTYTNVHTTPNPRP